MAENEHTNAARLSKSQNNLLIRCFVSLISVLLTHFSLFLVPHLFPTSSLIILLPLSGVLVLVVGGLGRICKNLVGLRASAPAFVVLSILYVWCVYFALIRQAISSILDIVFNAEIGLLLIGLRSIVSSDPGYVAYGSSYPGKPASSPFLHVESHFEDLEPSRSDARDTLLAVEESALFQRVRFCKVCKFHVKGFDHHCPAFGNCIGQKNHVLFIILLVGLIISEASYISCSSKFMKSHVLASWSKNTLSINLAYSTMLFSLLQVLWQVIFLIWHIYCVCFNITTDEWVNWQKYPEFQLVVEHQQGTRFKNPYDKGVLQNLKNFLKAEG